MCLSFHIFLKGKVYISSQRIYFFHWELYFCTIKKYISSPRNIFLPDCNVCVFQFTYFSEAKFIFLHRELYFLTEKYISAQLRTIFLHREIYFFLVVMCVSFSSHLFQRQSFFSCEHKKLKYTQECAAEGAKWALFGIFLHNWELYFLTTKKYISTNWAHK